MNGRELSRVREEVGWLEWWVVRCGRIDEGHCCCASGRTQRCSKGEITQSTVTVYRIRDDKNPALTALSERILEGVW